MNFHNKLSIAPIIALLSLFPASAAESIRYTLTPDPDGGTTSVEFEWSTRGRERSIAQILAATGRIDDIPTMLEGLKIDGADAIQDGATWHITHKRGATIRMSYRVKPPRRGLDWDGTEYPVTNYRFFHGLGKTFLITPQAGGGLPVTYDCSIRWKLPGGWSAACSLGPGLSVGAPVDPADLRNSVFYAGKITVETKVADGREVTVAMPDQFKFSSQRFLKVASEIIQHQCEFLGEKSFPPFVITIVPVGEPIKPGEARLSGAGLFNSFALWMAPQSQLSDGVENLFAHELFHQWNGRLLKAKMPDKLCYWFVEGFTDYYAQRILFESGYWSPRKYAKWINRHLREYAANPAHRATNEEIADNYWSARDTVGEVPYQRGQLLGIRWHKLAQERGVQRGLDAWMFKLLEHARKKPDFEFTNDYLRSDGIATLGKWFGEEFDRYVINAEIVDVPRDALEPTLKGAKTPIHEFDAGFDVETSRAASKIVGLRPNSRAARAGLREGDDAIGWLLQGDADKEVVIRVRRAGITKEIRYLPRGDGTTVMQFEP